MSRLVLHKLLYLTIFLCLHNSLKAQDQYITPENDARLNWFVAAGFGAQISGIKNEDFVQSNVSPLFNIKAGKWFAPYMALQIGYKGFYFYYIGDDIKHPYNYLYGEAVFNLTSLMLNQNIDRSWNVLLHGGAGYFYNHSYGRPNICANIGLQNDFRLTSQFTATVDVSGILGWDIYQGNEDILPGLSFGVKYQF